MPVIDLNFAVKTRYSPVPLQAQEELLNEYRQTFEDVSIVTAATTKSKASPAWISIYAWLSHK